MAKIGPWPSSAAHPLIESAAEAVTQKINMKTMRQFISGNTLERPNYKGCTLVNIPRLATVFAVQHTIHWANFMSRDSLATRIPDYENHRHRHWRQFPHQRRQTYERARPIRGRG